MNNPDAPAKSAAPHATRIIAMGSAALMDGFRLVGIETYPDATSEQLEALLEALMTGKERALLLLENGLARNEGPWLKRVRSEGGHIVITQVPPLHLAADYHTPVDELMRQMLGGSMAGEA
jgi:vacuolar-type H+-ATPase subunit F/Vma7